MQEASFVNGRSVGMHGGLETLPPCLSAVQAQYLNLSFKVILFDSRLYISSPTVLG